jgi:hypothetical protein
MCRRKASQFADYIICMLCCWFVSCRRSGAGLELPLSIPPADCVMSSMCTAVVICVLCYFYLGALLLFLQEEWCWAGAADGRGRGKINNRCSSCCRGCCSCSGRSLRCASARHDQQRQAGRVVAHAVACLITWLDKLASPTLAL